MKKQSIILVLFTFILAISFTGCSNSTELEATEENTIRLGINGDENAVWTHVEEELAKEGIVLDVVSFSDYIVPNTALAEGEIDANAFQTEIFFQNYLEESGEDLSILCYTILAPMGIYPGTSDSIESIPENAKIAIPNDPANGGRALILLEAAGIVEIDDSKGLLPTVNDITANPKNVEIVELVPAQIPTSIDEFSVACINNNVARDSGLSPLDDSIFIEDTSKEYVKAYYNIIAVQTEDLDDPKMLKLKEIYQSEENRAIIEEVYQGSAVPAF